MLRYKYTVYSTKNHSDQNLQIAKPNLIITTNRPLVFHSKSQAADYKIYLKQTKLPSELSESSDFAKPSSPFEAETLKVKPDLPKITNLEKNATNEQIITSNVSEYLEAISNRVVLPEPLEDQIKQQLISHKLKHVILKRKSIVIKVKEKSKITTDTLELIECSKDEIEQSHQKSSATTAPLPLIGKYKGEIFKYLPGKKLITTPAGKELFVEELQNKANILPVSDKYFVFAKLEGNVMSAVFNQPVPHVAKFLVNTVKDPIPKTINTKVIAATVTNTPRDLTYTNDFEGTKFTFIPQKGLFSSPSGKELYDHKLKGNSKILIFSKEKFVFLDTDAPKVVLREGHSAKQTIKFLELPKDNIPALANCELIGESTLTECTVTDN